MRLEVRVRMGIAIVISITRITWFRGLGFPFINNLADASLDCTNDLASQCRWNW
jgi:hypothetical protein